MVDGKEFFGGDVKTGLKNLPVNMIDKLKTYDKKSDLARVTGIVIPSIYGRILIGRDFPYQIRRKHLSIR